MEHEKKALGRMGNNADIIVVGGGVMGCATAYQLAKDGASVLLLEQFATGNHLGSSHGASRLFRLAHTSRFQGAGLFLFRSRLRSRPVRSLHPCHI